MRQFTFFPKHGLGDYVFHATPDSPKGIIIDVKYSVLEQRIQYLIAFGPKEDDQILCYEHELSGNKVF